jgi:superfamily I DNA/RNA helicase
VSDVLSGPRSEAIARVADLAYSTGAALADTGPAPGEVHAGDALVGRTSDAARVGTVKRAQGLEFKQVLLAHVNPRLLDAAPADPSEIERERRERGRREPYVGMTRARDCLWVSVRSGAARGR